MLYEVSVLREWGQSLSLCRIQSNPETATVLKHLRKWEVLKGNFWQEMMLHFLLIREISLWPQAEGSIAFFWKWQQQQQQNLTFFYLFCKKKSDMIVLSLVLVMQLQSMEIDDTVRNLHLPCNWKDREGGTGGSVFPPRQLLWFSGSLCILWLGPKSLNNHVCQDVTAYLIVLAMIS